MYIIIIGVKSLPIRKKINLTKQRKTRRYYNVPNITINKIRFKEEKIYKIIKFIEKEVSKKENLGFIILNDNIANKKINLNLTNLKLKEILDSIAFLSNSKYFRQLDKIIFTTQDKLIDNLIYKEFIIGDELLESFEQEDLDGFEGEDGKDNNKMIKKFLTSLGISFPEESFVSYIPKSKKLIVKNSPENIAAIETTISALKKENQQVFIQTQFMEITETLFKEISFLWDINLDETNLKSLKNVNPSANLRSFNTKTQKNIDLSSDLTSNVLTKSNLRFDLSNLFNIGSISGAQVTFLTRLINQDNNSNLIFAPKILTANGEEAIVESVREQLLPFEWSRAAANVNTGSATVRYPRPVFSINPVKLGVSFSATPNIQPDGFTIEIFIKPTIKELAGFDNYTQDVANNTIEIARIRGNNIATETHYSTLIIMPRINVRSLESTVSMWDGETITLGGLVNEREVKFEDKNPLLSKIPLLGKLFTNKGSNKIKYNLIVVMTASIVDSTGLNVRSTKNNFIPSY